MTISRIDDIDDERLAPFARLTERQLRNVLHPEESLVVCESLYVIALVVRLGLPLVSVLVDERHLDNLLESAPEIRFRVISPPERLPLSACARNLARSP